MGHLPTIKCYHQNVSTIKPPTPRSIIQTHVGTQHTTKCVVLVPTPLRAVCGEKPVGIADERAVIAQLSRPPTPRWVSSRGRKEFHRPALGGVVLVTASAAVASTTTAAAAGVNRGSLVDSDSPVSVVTTGTRGYPL